jgi:predicted porin
MMQHSKNTLALVLATLTTGLAATHACAQSAPEFTWYGTINMAAENSDDGSFIRNAAQSISSKLGIKGEKAINDELSAQFQVETGVAPDDTANSKAFANRNSFVGLKGKSWGQALLGTYDMPFKDLKGSTASMLGNDDVLEIVSNGKGAVRNATLKLLPDNLHTRQTNAIYYASPKFSGVQVKAAYGLNEPADSSVAKTPVYGASLEYNDGTWNAGYALETKESLTCAVATCTGTTANGNLLARKAMLGWKGADFSAGLVLSTIDNGLTGVNARLVNTTAVSGAYKRGDITYKLAYGIASESFSAAADGYNMMALEVAYALDKSVNVYGYYSAITNDNNSKARFEGGENKYSPLAGNDPRVLGVGVSYSF